MPDQTPNLSLPFIMPSQAQKHVTHNEAIELLDMIVQLTLEAVNAGQPPAAPLDGQAWALGAAPSGAWSGQAGKIATWRGGGWLFVPPREGWMGWVRGDSALKVIRGGQWMTVFSADGPLQIGSLLTVTPSLAPTTPTTGDIYFDSFAAKLRCYDGSIWQDLF